MAAYRRVYDMRVCRCGPGGRWWQPTTGSMTMHAVTCRLTAYSPGSAPAPYARSRVWVPFLKENLMLSGRPLSMYSTIRSNTLQEDWFRAASNASSILLSNDDRSSVTFLNHVQCGRSRTPVWALRVFG